METIDGSIPIDALDLSNCALTDNGADHLPCIRCWKSSTWSWADMNDDRMENLAGPDAAQDTQPGEQRVTDAGLKHLRGMTDLRELSLGYTEVRGPGLEVLTNLPRLEV